MNLVGKIQHIHNISLKECGVTFILNNELRKEIMDILENEYLERSDSSCEEVSEKKEIVTI